MDLSEWIQPGMTHEATTLVEEKYLALHVGSGSLRVLATPWMIAFMERISHQLLAAHLPKGYSSVGVQVNVEHLAPTPLGSTVTIKTRVLEVNGLEVLFAVEAWDEFEQVGKGQHRRFAIDQDRFLRRVERKTKLSGE